MDYLCLGCAIPLTSNNKLCGNCQQSPPAYHLVTAGAYQTPVKELISALKYRNNQLIAHEVADLLARRITQLLAAQTINKPDFLIAVPLHWKKHYQRGFNQANLIAECLSQKLNIPILDCCQRNRYTKAQVSLTFKQRQHNLNKAFSITKPITGHTIALVDDVYTTGSTLHELASTIIRAKDVDIQFWTIARTQLE
ncbi:phosphoribosyltransferase [Alteromonadales bacterium alter-6D02]|nr:phosphoribosyltransferase [Alteromonadales bacterium alter-6D02]